jgi:ABC-type ATPase involved in cell division
LLKTLYGDLTFKEGEGFVAGFNLKDMDWKKVPFLRRNLGVIFQAPILLPLLGLAALALVPVVYARLRRRKAR